MRVDLPTPDLEGADPAVTTAVRKACDSVTESPKSSEAWGELGIVLMIHGFANEAEKAFMRAEELDDSEFRWPYLRALNVFQEQPQRALTHFERALLLSNNDATIRGRLAEAYLTLGDDASAEKQFRMLLEKHPDDARAHFGLSQIAVHRGVTDEASRHLKSLADNPYCRKRAHQLIAQIQRRDSDKTAAEKTASLVASLPEDRSWPDPYEADAFGRQSGMFNNIERANDLRMQGEAAKSSQLNNQTEQQHPELYWMVEGRLCLQNGDLAAAEDALRKSLKISPEFIEAQYWLAQVLLKAGKHDQAADSFRKVIQMEASYAPAYVGLGHCLDKQRRTAEAVVELQNAIRYMPANSDAHRELGRLLVEQGETAQAIIHLQQALVLDPEDSQAKTLLRRCQDQLNFP